MPFVGKGNHILSLAAQYFKETSAVSGDGVPPSRTLFFWLLYRFTKGLIHDHNKWNSIPIYTVIQFAVIPCSMTRFSSSMAVYCWNSLWYSKHFSCIQLIQGGCYFHCMYLSNNLPIFLVIPHWIMIF